MYCIYVDENTIIPYQGEILKLYVGRRIIKAISNPSPDDLAAFGYMPFIQATVPEYDESTQKLVYTYSISDGKVIETVEVKETEEETEK